jgi:hypothetical protein
MEKKLTLLWFNHTVYVFVIFIICYSLLSSNAQAYDTKVIIVNGTMNHCRPELSCYDPFQVNISTGDTVTIMMTCLIQLPLELQTMDLRGFLIVE